jgi:hypothetical protein
MAAMRQEPALADVTAAVRDVRNPFYTPKA